MIRRGLQFLFKGNAGHAGFFAQIFERQRLFGTVLLKMTIRKNLTKDFTPVIIPNNLNTGLCENFCVSNFVNFCNADAPDRSADAGKKNAFPEGTLLPEELPRRNLFRREAGTRPTACKTRFPDCVPRDLRKYRFALFFLNRRRPGPHARVWGLSLGRTGCRRRSHIVTEERTRLRAGPVRGLSGGNFTAGEGAPVSGQSAA